MMPIFSRKRVTDKCVVEKDTEMYVGRNFEAERQSDLLKVKCVDVEDGLETVRGVRSYIRLVAILGRLV